MSRPPLPTWERVLRVAIGLVVVTAALITLQLPVNVCVAIIGVGIMITGFAGRCPVCALGGRGRG